MGKKAIKYEYEINYKVRKVRYRKRIVGLFSKARQLAALTGSKIAVLVVREDGSTDTFASNHYLSDIINQFNGMTSTTAADSRSQHDTAPLAISGSEQWFHDSPLESKSSDVSENANLDFIEDYFGTSEVETDCKIATPVSKVDSKFNEKKRFTDTDIELVYKDEEEEDDEDDDEGDFPKDFDLLQFFKETTI